MSAHEGGCLCGSTRYSVKTQPMRVTICHCRFCQRATGSAFLVEPIFGKSDLTLTAGEPKIYRHRSEGSGKIVNVHFCANCGTKLFLSFERFADVVGVYGGTFDDPTFWYTPERYVFARTKPDWLQIPEGIEVCQAMPE